MKVMFVVNINGSMSYVFYHLWLTRFFMEDCVRCHGFSIGMNFFSLEILHAAAAFADEEGIAQDLSIVRCVG